MKDYKKMYLEQTIQALNLEMNMIQMRAQAIQKKLPEAAKELAEYDSESKKSDTDKT
jgi:hypothetical protein